MIDPVERAIAVGEGWDIEHPFRAAGSLRLLDPGWTVDGPWPS